MRRFKDTPQFYSYRTDEEKEAKRKKEKSRTINLRINSKEEKMIKELKEIFDTNMDGTALKLGAGVGLKYLLATFGKDELVYLFQKGRARLSNDDKQNRGVTHFEGHL